MALSTLDIAAIRSAERSREPYDYLLGSDVLKPEAVDDLRRDFPVIDKPGYLALDEVQLKGRFRTLVQELESAELTEELSNVMGKDMHPYPRLTTIMGRSQPKYGAIHTDGPSKVMTMLVYMNDNWQAGEGGRLRVLYDGRRFEPFKVEVPPVMGTVFAFLRSDRSWHGHQPFAGERKVVQVAWMTDLHELARKKTRNRAAQFLKSIFGR